MARDDDDDDDDEAAAAREVTAQDKLDRYYWEQLRHGVVPTLAELRAESTRLGLARTDRQLRDLRFDLDFLAVRTPFRRPRHHMGPQVLSLGQVFMDLAVFQPHLRVFNRQAKYFITTVDALSQYTMAYPMASKTQAAWEAVVLQVIKDYKVLRSLVTDRDSSIAAPAFQARIFREHGVRWFHLRSRSKAFLAEQKIAYLKRRLGVAMAARGDNNWVDALPHVLADHNRRPVSGTDVRRSDVNKKNELAVAAMRQGLGAKGDASVLVNTHLHHSFSPRMLKAIDFRFKPGDRVLLSRSANYESAAKLAGGGDAFGKVSVHGAYFPKPYTVTEAFLKANATHFIMAYRLAGLEGPYYQQVSGRATPL